MVARTGELESIHPPRQLLLAVAIAILSMPISSRVLGDEIYRWVDEEGVVHYSDTRPHHDSPVTVLDIETSQSSDYDPVEDPYSILNQASRVHEIWLDFEAVRQARARERLDARDDRLEPSPRSTGSYYEYSTYPGYAIWASARNDGRGDRGDQRNALGALDLLGPRPQSINSGTHEARVRRSQLLPVVVPSPSPRSRD